MSKHPGNVIDLLALILDPTSLAHVEDHVTSVSMTPHTVLSPDLTVFFHVVLSTLFRIAALLPTRKKTKITLMTIDDDVFDTLPLVE